MQIKQVTTKQDLDLAESVMSKAFSSTPDSDLSDWLSFSYMETRINEESGKCLLMLDDNSSPIGAIYAQAENLINGKEGSEKWVIIALGVDSGQTGKGIGTSLITELENVLRKGDVKKLFTFTNKEDIKVINFYQKNGYSDAGWIKDYQYGKNNSAVFLLKYL